MRARLAELADFNDILALAKAAQEEGDPGAEFQYAKIAEIFTDYLHFAEPTVYVADDGGQLVGLVTCNSSDFDYKPGFYTRHRLLYIKPESRGTRAAGLLMRELVAWSIRIGAAEVHTGRISRTRAVTKLVVRRLNGGR